MPPAPMQAGGIAAYEALGVAPDATASQIKRAYREPPSASTLAHSARSAVSQQCAALPPAQIASRCATIPTRMPVKESASTRSRCASLTSNRGPPVPLHTRSPPIRLIHDPPRTASGAQRPLDRTESLATTDRAHSQILLALVKGTL